MISRKKQRSWSYKIFVRSGALTLLTLSMAGVGQSQFILAMTILLSAIVLPLGRYYFVRSGIDFLAEWEIGVTLAAVLMTGAMIGHAALELKYTLIRLPMSSQQLASLCLVTLAIGFGGRGGTQIVRGILDKVGTFPQQSDVHNPKSKTEESLDIAEYNRGRVIGNLERFVLLLLVLLGSYAALGFLVAAKGLVRIKELEDRKFAEYFLIGTLTSISIALVLGILLRYFITETW